MACLEGRGAARGEPDRPFGALGQLLTRDRRLGWSDAGSA